VFFGYILMYGVVGKASQRGLATIKGGFDFVSRGVCLELGEDGGGLIFRQHCVLSS